MEILGYEEEKRETKGKGTRKKGACKGWIISFWRVFERAKSCGDELKKKDIFVDFGGCARSGDGSSPNGKHTNTLHVHTWTSAQGYCITCAAPPTAEIFDADSHNPCKKSFPSTRHLFCPFHCPPTFSLASNSLAQLQSQNKSDGFRRFFHWHSHSRLLAYRYLHQACSPSCRQAAKVSNLAEGKKNKNKKKRTKHSHLTISRLPFASKSHRCILPIFQNVTSSSRAERRR